MRVTIENMEKLYPKYGNRLKWVIKRNGGIAEYSANPSDYFGVSRNTQLEGELLVEVPSRLGEPEL